MDIQYLTVNHLSTKNLIRFFSKVTILLSLQHQGTSCWIWSANRSKEGYGLIGWANNSNILTHRLMYAWLVHPLPRGKKYGEMDHLCKRTSCVNPLHLEFVDNWTNMIRSNNIGAQNLRKTQCPQGHLYTNENIYGANRGIRACRTCQLAKQKERFNADPEHVRRTKRESWRRKHWPNYKTP